ncbi:MAG: glycosyltransferase family 92 protein [Desulfovibrio sp.]|jgi:hypothetical protein|nr:glycosyltransferase family 92 protein [Desulfovibrio sp.]
MKYCALCCIAKNEEQFLKEWLAYHALIGFEHFIIYDNLSDVPIHRFLSGWAGQDSVTVLRNMEPLSQVQVYEHCLEAFGSRFQWIAFLDLDEFIRLRPARGRGADIRLFLPEFESYAGLGLNWRMFSSNGHETTPEGPVIASYTRCLGDNHHIKSVVQPSRIAACYGPHSFYAQEGEYVVNAAHVPIPGGMPFAPAVTERIAVNHYFYKSRQCFEKKIAKGNPCNIMHRMEEFEGHLAKPVTEDTATAAYAKAVLEALAAPEFAAAPASACPDYAAAARTIQAGREGEDLSQALLRLNEAWMGNRGESHDPVLELGILALRAHAATLRREYAPAEVFLKRAFLGKPERQSLMEYASLCARMGRMSEAKTTLDIVRHYT